jgi:N-acetylmuramoyl-L-alanine amidase
LRQLEEVSLQTHQRVWNDLQLARLPRFLVRFLLQGGRTVVLGLLLAGALLGIYSKDAQAYSNCSPVDHTYNVVRGDTLNGIAARYGINYRILVAYNHIANPNLIYPNQRICIPHAGPGNSNKGSKQKAPVQPKGTRNIFPYGTCTWWADQRFFQLHGFYVPWRTRANAWEWVYRAYEYHWPVSSRPSVGAIIDLQPWVQGAYGFGHVAIVERILSNGRVIASTMNWGAFPWRITYVEFTPGRGVSFISQ